MRMPRYVVPQKKHTHASAAYAVSWGALTFEEPFKGYHVSLILTLTINPAIDRTVSVDKLVFEDRAYILARTERAGGRGINASQVLHGFGAKTIALLTAGGDAGDRMEKSLASMHFPFEVVRVKAESRTN